MELANRVSGQNSNANMSTEINEVHHGLKPVGFTDAKLKGEDDKKQVAGDSQKSTVDDYLEEKFCMTQSNQTYEHLDKGEDHLIEWYKGRFALNYFTSGSIDKNEIQSLAPYIALTEEQVNKIYSVISEIGEELVKGIGMAVVMHLLRSDGWIEGKRDILPEFETRDNRIKWFRQCFYETPLLVVSIVHEINPAMDLQWIMSNTLYTGADAWYNVLRIRLRHHLFTRAALICDVIFKGMLMVTNAGEIGNDSERTKQMLHKCFRRNPITDAVYGAVGMNDWPIKEPYNPNNKSKPWDTWCKDWKGVKELQENSRLYEEDS